MNSTTNRPVVVGFDGSPAAGRAVSWAASEAVSRGRDLLVVQAVRDPVPAVPWPLSSPSPFATELVSLDAAREHSEQALTQLARQCRQDLPQLHVRTTAPAGHPVTALCDLGSDAELVVLGASGHSGLTTALLGSTASELVRELPRPVVVVRGQPRSGPVVVGVDGSDAGDRAIAFAFDFAARHGADLVAVHAWADLPADTLSAVQVWDGADQPLCAAAEELLDRVLSDCHDQYPDVTVRRRVYTDGPTHALLAEAEDAELLVVGSHGRGALGRLVLGSVSHAVLHRASCPVAVVRAER